ncbi:extracellular solute-binding protein [Paenibacillus sp. NPDC056579]|uniref:extracellular solute-binding protein n=1 Tax=unclassified Paenibacillus TaxID=185978 RepID=UPI001EF90F61|nr:extracellular solute-binding protein [Paenibacillus sp. H1-7]ULL16272.1 extracellular solute-binding protein [Paenibacillus sp. H1-7]
MKKALSLVMVTAVAAGSLAGCAPKNDGSANSSNGAGATGPTKFSIALPITTGDGYGQRSPDLNKDKWVQRLNKLANVELDVRLIQREKMSVLFAGNDIPDVLGTLDMPTGKDMAGSVEAGVFMPLDDLLKEYAPTVYKNVPKAAWDSVTYKGQIYGIPSYLTNPSRRGTYIRTDLLEKTGLAAPKTVDEFLNVMRAFKKLGVENPYQMRENFKYADILLGAFDVLPYKDQFEKQGDQIVPKFFDVENTQKALQAYKTMYDEGLMPKDFATISSTDYSKNINAGKAGMWSANVGTGLRDFRTNIKAIDPAAKVDVIPSPKGPEGKGGYFLYSPMVTAYYINKNVDKQKAIGIMKYIEWMQTEEAAKFFSFGVEGENYTVENGKINYKFPTNKEESQEESFRTSLRMASDATYNKLQLELSADGKEILSAFDNVLSKEGLPGIGFYPDLKAFSKYPDLTPLGDTGPKLIIDHMIKMIYGKEPISDWPKVIEEYKAKGGNEIIKEATERYNNKDGVSIFNNQ